MIPMPKDGQIIQLLAAPRLYSRDQIQLALALARVLDRGMLLLLERPDLQED